MFDKSMFFGAGTRDRTPDPLITSQLDIIAFQTVTKLWRQIGRFGFQIFAQKARRTGRA